MIPRRSFLLLIILIGVLYIASFSVLAGKISFAATSDEERKLLEQQLTKLEKQIIEYEQAIENYKKQGKTYQTEINKLTTQIGKINLQIKAINISLTKLNKEIDDNQSQLKKTEDKLNFNKDALGRSLESLYEKGNDTIVEMILKSPKLSDFFGDITDLVEVQNNLTQTVKNIADVRNELIDLKEQLAVKKNDIEALKAYQDAQRKAVQSTREQKNSLLAIIKNKEAKSQDLLKETKKTAAQIRGRIFELLGGGELTFEEAYKFAKYAEQATGVRAALILAVLDRESALGQNVGRCNYRTAMHPTRDMPIFLALVSELNINPDSITVSCPNRDGMYGGAMGPAQFIPSTWAIYKDRIKELNGTNLPSPWRNADAFMATALYLKDAGASKGALLSEERIAVARYYAGGRWRSYLWTYGDRVVTRAQQFQQDIDILSS